MEAISNNSARSTIPLVAPARRRGWGEIVRFRPLSSRPHVALVITRDGQLVRILRAGSERVLSDYLALPCEIQEVDERERLLTFTLSVPSSDTNYAFLASLQVIYRVTKPARVAIEIADPLGELERAIRQKMFSVGRNIEIEQAGIAQEYFTELFQPGHPLHMRCQTLGLHVLRADISVDLDEKAAAYATALREFIRERPLLQVFAVASADQATHFVVQVGGFYRMVSRNPYDGSPEDTEYMIRGAIDRIVREVALNYQPDDVQQATRSITEALRYNTILKAELLEAGAEVIKPVVTVHVPQPLPLVELHLQEQVFNPASTLLALPPANGTYAPAELHSTNGRTETIILDGTAWPDNAFWPAIQPASSEPAPDQHTNQEVIFQADESNDPDTIPEWLSSFQSSLVHISQRPNQESPRTIPQSVPQETNETPAWLSSFKNNLNEIAQPASQDHGVPLEPTDWQKPLPALEIAPVDDQPPSILLTDEEVPEWLIIDPSELLDNTISITPLASNQEPEEVPEWLAPEWQAPVQIPQLAAPAEHIIPIDILVEPPRHNEQAEWLSPDWQEPAHHQAPINESHSVVVSSAHEQPGEPSGQLTPDNSEAIQATDAAPDSAEQDEQSNRFVKVRKQLAIADLPDEEEYIPDWVRLRQSWISKNERS